MKTLTKIINPLLIIGIAVVLRLIPHVPNFVPITAMGLFGGVYVNKRYALFVPLIALFISDYLLLYVNPFSTHLFDFRHFYAPSSVWYGSAMLGVYGSFLISGLIGLWLRNHKSVQNIILASLIGSLQFFLITNAAVWIAGAYDRSLLGLWESYVAGIPFFKWTVLGDLFYTGAFFGGYEFVLRLTRSSKVAHA